VAPNVNIDETVGLSPAPDRSILAVDNALTAFSRLAPRQAKVVDLRYFGGGTEEEIVTALDISPRTARRDWTLARAWLLRQLSHTMGQNGEAGMSPDRFQEIEDLYHAARNATAGERAALLEQVDPDLRREVESLLAQPPGGFLDQPAIHNAPDLLEDSTVTALAAGACLGPYRIEGKLGAGGMGEVFHAIDTRLGRAVAIKITRDRFSTRFEREARAIASLNHPNICQIYDVGPNYLVMELVDGPTLAERIKGGAVPLEEALTITRQIGDALEAAHEKGIIHRDLKPANIKIKPDGTVKVLDFGLAKIAEQAPPATSPKESPTVSTGATRVGQIMGTAAYMAPEQARGKVVDKRADIWAFGVVLYEMFTGRRLFQGETISDTLAVVLTKEPEWERLPSKAQRLLKACLEKDPKRRLRDIADAWRLLEDAPRPAARSRMSGIAAGVLAITTALALWAPWRRPEVNMTRPSPHLDLNLGAGISLADDAGPAMALSPDGTRIVFVAQDQSEVPRLFTRRLDQPNAVRLSGTEGAKEPFFSPDGQWVGFFAAGKLRKTRIEGGDPVSLCDAPAGRGASWGEDGNIIVALDGETALSQVPSGGGSAIPVTELAPGDASHRWPYVLPGGKFVLFTVSRVANNFDEAGIALLSLPEHTRKMLLDHAGMYPRYLPSGHLVYVTKGSLFAAPFHLKHLQLTGGPTRLAEVAADTPRGFAQVDFSPAGIFAFRTHGGQGLSTPQWLDGVGKTEPLGLEAARYHYLRLSPDGTRLAYVSTQGSVSDLFIYDWQRGIKTRLTNGHVTQSPVWSPDGRFVVFRGVGGMFAMQIDGGGTPTQLTRTNNPQSPAAFSPDGRRVVFTEIPPGAKGEIRIMPVESQGGQMRAGEPQPLLNASGITTYARFSPDGRWLAYANAEGGPYEIYVRAFPDNGRQVQVSNAGGIMPFWSLKKNELFYRTEDQRIMVANYTVKGDSFIPQRPRLWYSKRIANVGNAGNLDVAPDGKRFVVLMPAEATEDRESQNHVTLVMNFFDEVRRRVTGQAK
jgi:serine/threonine-protein kinase